MSSVNYFVNYTENRQPRSRIEVRPTALPSLLTVYSDHNLNPDLDLRSAVSYDHEPYAGEQLRSKVS